MSKSAEELSRDFPRHHLKLDSLNNMPLQIPSLQELASTCIAIAFVDEAESPAASARSLSPSAARRMATLAQLLCATGSLSHLPEDFVNDLMAGETVPSMSAKWTYGTLKAAFRNPGLRTLSLRGHARAANLLPELTPSNFPGLQVLDLSGTTITSNVPLRHTLLALAPQLRDLDLSRCAGLSSFALDAVYACSKLEKLSLKSTGTAVTSVQFQRPPSAVLAATASDDGWSVASSRRRRGGAKAVQQVAASTAAPPQQFPAFGKSSSLNSAASSWGRSPRDTGSSSGGWGGRGGGSWRDAAPPSPPAQTPTSTTFLAADEHSSVCELVLSALPESLQHLDVEGCAGEAEAWVALPSLLSARCRRLHTLHAGYCTAASHVEVQSAWTDPVNGLIALHGLRALHLPGLEWAPAKQLSLLTAAWQQLDTLQLQPHEGASDTYSASSAVFFYDLLQVPAASVRPDNVSLLVALPSPADGGSFPVGHCLLDLTHGPLAKVQRLGVFLTQAPVPQGQWRPHTSGLSRNAAGSSAVGALAVAGHRDMHLDIGMILAALPGMNSLGIANCSVQASLWLHHVPLAVQNAAKRAVAGLSSSPHTPPHGLDGEVAAQLEADTSAAHGHIRAALQQRCLRQLELFACSLLPGCLVSQLCMQRCLEQVCFRHCTNDMSGSQHGEPLHAAANIALAPAWLLPLSAGMGVVPGVTPPELLDACLTLKCGGDAEDESDSDEEDVYVQSPVPWAGDAAAGNPLGRGGTRAAQHLQLLAALSGHVALPHLRHVWAWGPVDTSLAGLLVLAQAVQDVGVGAASKGPLQGQSTPPAAAGAGAAVPTLDQLAAMWDVSTEPSAGQQLQLQLASGEVEDTACAVARLQIRIAQAGAGQAVKLAHWAAQTCCDINVLEDTPAVTKFKSLQFSSE